MKIFVSALFIIPRPRRHTDKIKMQTTFARIFLFKLNCILLQLRFFLFIAFSDAFLLLSLHITVGCHEIVTHSFLIATSDLKFLPILSIIFMRWSPKFTSTDVIIFPWPFNSNPRKKSLWMNTVNWGIETERTSRRFYEWDTHTHTSHNA